MAQMRQKDPTSITTNRPFAAEFTTRNKQSMLFTMLPAVVQSHLPRLPSIRRSVSMYGLANRRKSAQTDSRPSSGGSSTGSRTPDGGYNTALVLSHSRAMVAEEEVATYFAESASSDEDSSAEFRRRKGKNVVMEVAETKSGIGWKFANQGKESL
jgi:hypothetical protein